MAAALDDEALAHGAPHRLAEIDPRNRAPRTGAGAAGLERNGKGGSPEPFLEARCDQSHHARMPARSGSHDDRALLLRTQRSHGLGLGFGERRKLDGLALAVEPVELTLQAACIARDRRP